MYTFFLFKNDQALLYVNYIFSMTINSMKNNRKVFEIKAGHQELHRLPGFS